MRLAKCTAIASSKCIGLIQISMPLNCRLSNARASSVGTSKVAMTRVTEIAAREAGSSGRATVEQIERRSRTDIDAIRAARRPDRPMTLATSNPTGPNMKVATLNKPADVERICALGDPEADEQIEGEIVQPAGQNDRIGRKEHLNLVKRAEAAAVDAEEIQHDEHRIGQTKEPNHPVADDAKENCVTRRGDERRP